MTIQTIQEGLALYALQQLEAERIPELAMLFLENGCNVPEMAALAGELPLEHPADRRAEFERALRLAGQAVPERIHAARFLRTIYARRGSSRQLSPRDAASEILGVFQIVRAELPKTTQYVGDSFGISALVGLFYAYDDVPPGDAGAVVELDRELHQELTRIAGNDEA